MKFTLFIGSLLIGVILFACGAAVAQDTTPDSKQSAGPVKDFNPEALWDGRKIAPIKTLDKPTMVSALEASFLDDSEYVLGIWMNGESRAYPTRFVWWHHAVNDKIAGKPNESPIPIAITYCSVCNTGIAYDRRLDGRELNLDFFGLYNGVVALCDRESGSAFLHADGRFVTESLAGKSLAALPLLDTTWGEWKALHPDTLVMSPEGPFSARYAPKGKNEPRGYDRFPAPFFKPTVKRGDKRLPPFDKVLGVVLPAGKDGVQPRRAYPIKALESAGGLVNDESGDMKIVVFLQPGSATANAFSRKLGNRTLTFEARKTDAGGLAYYDRETSSRWNIEGRAEEGPLLGSTLNRLENHLSQWYGWAAYFPETTIYGRSEPPQPGNPFDDPPAERPADPKPPTNES
jgi:hypothetical protein